MLCFRTHLPREEEKFHHYRLLNLYLTKRATKPNKLVSAVAEQAVPSVGLMSSYALGNLNAVFGKGLQVSILP